MLILKCEGGKICNLFYLCFKSFAGVTGTDHENACLGPPPNQDLKSRGFDNCVALFRRQRVSRFRSKRPLIFYIMTFDFAAAEFYSSEK